MSDNKGLGTLRVWRRSMHFVKRIHNEVLPLLPNEEKWAMTNQLRRAAQSIPANIAEGYGRFDYQEGIRFCYIARGSLEETFTFLTLAQEFEYIELTDYESLAAEMDELKRMLNGYIAFLKRTKRGETEPGAVYESTETYSTSPDLENLDSQLPE